MYPIPTPPQLPAPREVLWSQQTNQMLPAAIWVNTPYPKPRVRLVIVEEPGTLMAPWNATFHLSCGLRGAEMT